MLDERAVAEQFSVEGAQDEDIQIEDYGARMDHEEMVHEEGELLDVSVHFSGDEVATSVFDDDAGSAEGEDERNTEVALEGLGDLLDQTFSDRAESTQITDNVSYFCGNHCLSNDVCRLESPGIVTATDGVRGKGPMVEEGGAVGEGQTRDQEYDGFLNEMGVSLVSHEERGEKGIESLIEQKKATERELK